MKLLALSVGSLVGQNLLDAIQNRRDKIYVVGLNSIAKNPRNFRCDKTYLTSPISRKDQFESELIEILKKEKPDIVLPGRDEDVLFLTKFKEKYPEYSDQIPFGSSRMPAIMLDKYESFRFGKENGLPFADSFFYSDTKDKSSLKSFLQKIGFPVVIKPKVGFGSKGVKFLVNEEHINNALQSNDLLFQEYLGTPKEFESYCEMLKTGIPLFFDVPDEKQCAGQTIIAPDGTLSEVYCSIVQLIRGYLVNSQILTDPKAHAIVKDCAKAMVNYGWYGSLNVQMKKDKNGNWKIFEFNPRMTGSTSARHLLGYDEFGTLTGIFKPEFNIPNDSTKDKKKATVSREFTDYLVVENDLEELTKNKVWEKIR